jgi:PAS domain S-box-containing protein
MEIKFDNRQFNRIFPFHLEINTNLEILSIGKSLKKIIGLSDLKSFPELFKIERPFLENITFQSIFNYRKEYFILKHYQGKILLKGQVEYLKEKNSLLFLLTPWAKTIEDLKSKQLLISDFAYYDLTFDYLHIIKSIEINADEIKELVNQLTLKNKLLSSQEEKHKNIIQNINLGLIEVDNNDIIQFANQAFADMTGYTLKELIGKSPSKLLLDDDTKKILAEKQQKRLQGISDAFEITIKKKNGEVRNWIISGAPNINNNGELIGSIGVHLDITEQKKLEKELEKASKTKDLFLANMSHEIRTPLHILIGLLQLIDKEDVNSKVREYLLESKLSSQHLLSIVNDILDISKIESGEMTLQLKPVDLVELIKSIKVIFQPQAIEKNIKLNIFVDSKCSILLGDEIRIRQVLINFVSNAIKFTEIGEIDIVLKILQDSINFQEIQFQIKDTGIGMTKEFSSKIYDLYSQESENSNRKFQGTGLGMSISKKLIDLMHGNLSIISEKGIGTVIDFRIQLDKYETKTNIESKENIDYHAILNKQILIVEDNNINRLILKTLLNNYNCFIDEAKNGYEAIELIQQKTYDLILMDIQMPQMDGVTATIKIRENSNTTTPIIALTANSFQKDIDLYLSVGMNDYISKPYTEEDFLRKVTPYL